MLGSPRSVLARRGKISWAAFDETFYRHANPAAADLSDPESLATHYLDFGAAAGCSPNRWFDETYYRAAHPDVDALIRDGVIRSGFAHYRQVGYRDRAPHWLFDPAFYLLRNPTLTEATLQASDFVNLYDHYLKHGAIEGRQAHPLFDPAFYKSQLGPDQRVACDAIGAFAHFLTQQWIDASGATREPPTSPSFDPRWYCAHHQEVAEALRSGRWHSALHHFLANRRSGRFQPLPRIKINIDRPTIVNGQASLDGALDLIGWAAANHPVASVEIFVDDGFYGRAHYGLRTEGVAAAFQELTHAAAAGFRFVGSRPLPPGRHLVRVVARGEGGHESVEGFEVEARSPLMREGPWSLRRRMDQGEADEKLGRLREAGVAPEFVIAMRADPARSAATARSMASLAAQIYPHWRLTEETPPGGDAWVVSLTPGDELGVDALLELALQRLAEPEADFIYSDDRRLDPTTGEVAPFFKPDWSPDLLLSMNYIGRAWAASARLLAAGEGYERVLRLTGQARRVSHVAKVLWGCGDAVEGDARGLELVLREWGLAGSVEAGRVAGTWRVRWAMVGVPKVSIVILTAGKGGLIEEALRSLRTQCVYPALEVIVVDTVPGRAGDWKATARGLADRMLEDGAAFNWAAMNNRAAREASGDVLVFLNDDVRFGGPWLAPMLEQIQRVEVGVVGPLLVYPDGVVQQAGMILTESGGRHAFHGVAEGAPGPFGLASVQRNVAAVTGACLMVRRAVFEGLGGFDERFDIVNNDLDFCLRCEAAGLLVVFTPHARVVHHESVSRAGVSEEPNALLFREVWRERLARGDRWFNPNLAAGFSDYRPDWG